MMRHRTGAPGLALAWLLLAGCGQAQTPAAAQAQAPASSGDPKAAVATIDGVPITRGELEQEVAPQVAKLEEQAHQIRRQQLDDMIANRLIAAEAKKRGMSPEALLKVEVTDKVAPLTQTDIDAFVLANRARMPEDPATVMPQIRRYLDDHRTGQRRDAFLEELKAKAKVAVLLKAPPVFRAPIDLAGTPVRGPQNAKVTIVEFSDFHCPFCRRVQPTLTQVLEKYPTQVRLVYKHFPLDSLHPEARRAAEASWCAQQQDRFWQFHDLIYAGGPEQSSSAATLATLAGRAGLDTGTFQKCLASDKPATAIQTHLDEGSKYGVSGTPGFFINGRFLSGAVPLEEFVRVVDEELGK
jgi:protein-disulfide isomerase